jgi:hypothetical protein
LTEGIHAKRETTACRDGRRHEKTKGRTITAIEQSLFQGEFVRSNNQYALIAFRRVQGFLDANATQVGVLSPLNARKVLDESVAALEAHAVDQSSLGRETSGTLSLQKSLETELRKLHMHPIAEFARASLRGVPEYSKLTQRSGRLKGVALVTAARSMANAAEPYAEVLASNGFANAVAELKQGADNLEAAITGRGDLQVGHAGATKGITEQTKRGQEAVRMLNAAIERKFAKDATFLASWRSAKRISAKPGVPRGSGLTLVPANGTPTGVVASA